MQNNFRCTAEFAKLSLHEGGDQTKMMKEEHQKQEEFVGKC